MSVVGVGFPSSPLEELSHDSSKRTIHTTHRKDIVNKKVKSILAVAALTVPVSAYSDSWLYEGFDWSLPDYATVSEYGAMLDINGNQMFDDGEVRGALIRVLWRESEANKGEFNFDRLESILEELNGGPALVRLEVNSKCHMPDWASIPHSRTQNLQFWKPEYIEQLSGFVTKFAEEYKDDPRVVGVHLGMSDGEYYQNLGNGNIQSNCPGGTTYEELVDGSGRAGWGEFYWTVSADPLNDTDPNREQSIYEADGLTPENFESSVINIIDMYVDAFGAANAGKLVFMSYDDHGSAEYIKKLETIHEYALSKGLGNRGGQIEAWMRNTDNVYGVNLVTGSNTDGSCSANFHERFADSIAGRYWGEEIEFFGDLGYVTDAAVNPSGFVGPLSNQAYRFYVSSMRALQLRRNHFSIHLPGHNYLRSINDQYEYEYTNAGAYDSALLTKYKSGDFITYLSKTLGRTRSDTPDAFLVFGERTIRTRSGLYPTEYRPGNTREPCLITANNRGYTTVSDFGRWLSVVSKTEGDESMRKDLPRSENNWGLIMSAPRNGSTYELYARKSNAIYLDINDQLIQERCANSCNIQVKVVFKDDRVMSLQTVPTNGTPSETLTTFGGGQTRTATFELNDFSGGGSLPDFHIKTLDGSDLSVLMMRVNFEASVGIQLPATPVVLQPTGGDETTSGVTFSWKPVAGATSYRVSYSNGGVYDSGVFNSAEDLNCASGTCSHVVYQLSAGASQWWVRSRNSEGLSPWSTTGDFVVAAPAKPVLISPVNNVDVTGPITLNWWPTAGALEYRVSYANSGSYNGGTFVRAEQLNCGSGICSFTVTGLSAGSGMWWVQSKSYAGESRWSDTGNFVVRP